MGRFMEMVTECAGGRSSDDALESFKTKNPGLRTPDVVEKRWSDHATWRRILIPLLVAPLAHPMGEGSGVRAVVPAHLNSMCIRIQGAESGFLSLRPEKRRSRGGGTPSSRSRWPNHRVRFSDNNPTLMAGF